MSRPIRTDGIRTLADIKLRCTVDEFTGCWHWKGAKTGGVPQPSFWFPPLARRTTIGVAVCFIKTGAEPAPGVRWHCTCETKGCANPDHRVAGNKSTQMLAAKMIRCPVQRARIAAGKRAVSKLSDEAAADIAASIEPLRVVAERHGISIGHAGRVRTGVWRRPLAGRASSVFNWAGSV